MTSHTIDLADPGIRESHLEGVVAFPECFTMLFCPLTVSKTAQIPHHRGKILSARLPRRRPAAMRIAVGMLQPGEV